MGLETSRRTLWDMILMRLIQMILWLFFVKRDWSKKPFITINPTLEHKERDIASGLNTVMEMQYGIWSNR